MSSQQQSFPLLYRDFCNETIIGEKQPWNRHKKVITFVLFSAQPGGALDEWLLNGMKVQSDLAKKFYPEWVIQVYSIDLKDEYVEELVAYENVEVLQCRRLGNPAKNMMHRFLAVDNRNVCLMMSRDIDSRFSLRELMAVNEWIASPLKFHAMRDHPGHSTAVMGGMFGMKRGVLDEQNVTMTALIQKAESEYPYHIRIPGCCGDDQNFLAMYV